ncbi:hypothetical protein ACFY7C_21365 [Streptomyces sp. NPDC012769]|uniref:hypothetical protein n=1 Tax=Streptomyces sp. NPDC012769 TaxID=3364848 RepID=UPI00367803EC
MSGSSGGGVLYALAVGVWMTVFGVVVATDFRGSAHRLHAISLRSAAFGGPFSRRAGVGFVRVLAGVFALLGPVLLVEGVLQVSRGETHVVGDAPRPPLPFLLLVLAAMALAAWSYWRRRGWLRREWAGGVTRRRIATVVVTGCFAGFAAGLGLGLPLLSVTSWALGAGAGLYLLVAGRTER